MPMNGNARPSRKYLLKWNNGNIRIPSQTKLLMKKIIIEERIWKKAKAKRLKSVRRCTNSIVSLISEFFNVFHKKYYAIRLAFFSPFSFSFFDAQIFFLEHSTAFELKYSLLWGERMQIQILLTNMKRVENFHCA